MPWAFKLQAYWPQAAIPEQFAVAASRSRTTWALACEPWRDHECDYDHASSEQCLANTTH